LGQFAQLGIQPVLHGASADALAVDCIDVDMSGLEPPMVKSVVPV
jgi:hypothetical protein